MLSALIQDQHLQIYFSARQSIYSHIMITINLFTQRKAVKRPSNVIWTAICPLLCSIRGSFRGTFPQLAVTTVTPVTAPGMRLCSGELHYAAFFLFLEDKGYAPGYARWKRDHIAFCKCKMLALFLASHLYLQSSNLRRVFAHFKSAFSEFLIFLRLCILVQSSCSLFAFALYHYLVMNCLFFPSFLSDSPSITASHFPLSDTSISCHLSPIANPPPPFSSL